MRAFDDRRERRAPSLRDRVVADPRLFDPAEFAIEALVGVVGVGE
jgi:hypothetical protein